MLLPVRNLMFTIFLSDSGYVNCEDHPTLCTEHELVDAIESMDLPRGVKLETYLVLERGKVIVQGNGYKL